MEFNVVVDIAAPPSRVWAVIADVERWREWTASITRIELLDGTFHEGARARVRQPKLPPAVWQVTRVEPERGFTWVSRSPGALVTAHHDIEAVGAASRVTLAIRYEGLVGRLVGRLFAGITRRYVRMEADGLKRRAEGA